MAEAQFETDDFLKLLTEALRAGPGSPQWHDALTRLKANNLDQADEYSLLLTVREDLESGREYRGIRAGPLFTRKVMQRIDDEAAGGGHSASTATIIALIAGLIVVAAVVTVSVVIIHSRTPGGNVADLAAAYFSTPIVASDFSQKVPADWDKWTKFGAEAVISDRSKGLGAGTGAADKSGGIYFATPIPPAQSFAYEAKLTLAKAASPADLQLFISEDPKAASPREFVVDLKNGDLSAYTPDIQNVGSASVAPGVLTLTIKMDREFVIVEYGERQLYAGRHGLAGAAARYPGLRFSAHGGDAARDDVIVHSIRILRP